MRTLPWYNINHALSVELGLRGAELQIYSALKVLTSKDGSWKGTANELEDSALTGKGEDTITNIVKKLALRGLFKADIKKGLGISIDFPKNSEALPNNSEVHPNNSELHPNNSEVPKESNKEKLNNNNINNSKSVSIKNPDENGQTDFGFLGSCLKNALDVEFDSFFKKWMATFLPVKKTVAREKFDALLDHFSSEEIFGLLDFCAAQPKLTGAVGNKKMNIYWFCDHFTELLQRQNNTGKKEVEVLTYSQFKDRFHTTDKAGWCYLKERTDRGERLLCRISDQPASGYTLDRECFHY